MYEQASEIRIPVLGMSLAAKVYGQIGDEPMLALHGYLDNAATFDNILPLLGKDGKMPAMFIVCLELPGHGLSDHMPRVTGNYLLDWMHLVIAVADRFGWKKFGIMGHSLGGGIGGMLAGVYPERITFFISIDSPLSTGVVKSPASAVERMRASLKQRPKLADYTPNLYENLEEAMKRSRRNVIYQQCYDSSLAILIKRSTVVYNGGLIFQHDPKLREDGFYSLSEKDCIGFLALIECPVLHLEFTNGWTWPHDRDMILRRHDAIKNFKKVIVEGSHHGHLDHPERCAPHIIAFLEAFLPSKIHSINVQNKKIKSKL